ARFRAAAQVGADALPQVVQAATAPVRGNHETATQFDALPDEIGRVRRVVEKGMRVEPADAVAFEDRPALAQPVRADDHQRFGIPEHDMAIVAIEAVQVAPAAGAFADAPEGHFAQAADLADGRAFGFRIEQHDLLAVAGAAQPFATRQRLLDGDWRLGMRDG